MCQVEAELIAIIPAIPTGMMFFQEGLTDDGMRTKSFITPSRPP